MQGRLSCTPYDFVLIVPPINVQLPNGELVCPVYLRPVTAQANDFVNAAYATHKRGIGNSLMFTAVERFYEALDGLSAMGLKVEIL